MASIEHPMTRHPNQKELNVKPQQVKETVVMSPEDEELIRQQMQELEAKAQAGEVSQAVVEDPVIENEVKRKKALESLILFNKTHKRKVKVGNVTFTMKILNARDSDEVYEEVLRLSAEDQVTKTGRMLLAASLIEADGVPLETAYNGPEEVDKPLLQRYHIISGWPAPLTNNLTNAYQKLLRESEQEFSFDFLD